jgi:hypothetical protein
MTDAFANQSPEHDTAHAHSGSSVNQIRISEKSKLLWVFVGINLAVTLGMFAEWRISEREARMLQYYLLELDAKFIASGLKKPEDSIAGKLHK